jgi:DMSO/TMAO reductase YedYZ molybdopterin-dependent catalytic subunit
MTSLTRGFAGRGGARRDPRLPPGQYDTGRSWPVLTAEPTPHVDTYTRTCTVEGFVQKSTTWCWEQLRALPQSVYAGDVHGATTSSKLGMTFTGVSVDTLLSAAKPLADATHVLACCHDEAEPVSCGGSIEAVMADALCRRRHRAGALRCARPGRRRDRRRICAQRSADSSPRMSDP